jgi:hypothetical protein
VLLICNRATFVVTNAFALIDVKNSRANTKRHAAEPAPEMAANGSGAAETAV